MSRTTDLRRIPLTVDPEERPPWQLAEAADELLGVLNRDDDQ